MNINKYKKIFSMFIISIILFLILIMIRNESYASYGEKFGQFLVKDNNNNLVNGSTVASITMDQVYQISYAFNFSAFETYVKENCQNKDGSINKSKAIEYLEDYSLDLEDEKDSVASNDKEKKNYDSLNQIIAYSRNLLRDMKSDESIGDMLKRNNIMSQVYNEDGTINGDLSSNAEYTKDQLMNFGYSDIYNFLNDPANVGWDNTYSDIKRYKGLDYNSTLSDSDKREIKMKWAEIVIAQGSTDGNINDYLKAEIAALKADKYYRAPNVTTSSSSSSIDDVIEDGDSFISVGNVEKVKIDKLQSFSSNIYNILLTIGGAVAVITGGLIGLRYMLGSVEEKADIKSLMIPYVVGCVIIFGSFAIWKLVVTILQQI